MYEGTISTVKIDRGFGFISATGQPDVFMHCTELSEDLPFDETLQERRVRFDIQQSTKGPRAVGVVPI